MSKADSWVVECHDQGVAVKSAGSRRVGSGEGGPKVFTEYVDIDVVFVAKEDWSFSMDDVGADQSPQELIRQQREFQSTIGDDFIDADLPN